MMSKGKIVCVDFDGTCVMHEYPKIGQHIPNAVSILKKLNQMEVKIILRTIRSEEYLQEAVNWFFEREIKIWAVNQNPNQKNWSKSPKAYAHIGALLSDALPYSNVPLNFKMANIIIMT